MKILIIQTAFIGDVVLATPLVEKLKEKYPSSKIDFLLKKGNEGLFDNHPHINKIFIFDKKKKYKNLISLIKEIRGQSYDYVINVQRFFTTGLITALSKGKVKIGFDKNPLSIFYTQKHKHDISQGTDIHEVERNLLLIKELTDSSFKKPKLYPSQEHEKIIPNNHQYICIAPTSVWFTKQYPVERWCELIRKIPEKYEVYLIGSPQDIELCEKIRTATDTKKVVIAAGKLNLLESVALIKHAQMTFTNDSAPLHFASSVNAPVTAIFCSTIPEFGFGPLSKKSIIVETEQELTCRPCGLHGKKSCPKKHFKCSEIEAEEIIMKSHLN